MTGAKLCINILRSGAWSNYLPFICVYMCAGFLRMSLFRGLQVNVMVTSQYGRSRFQRDCVRKTTSLQHGHQLARRGCTRGATASLSHLRP